DAAEVRERELRLEPPADDVVRGLLRVLDPLRWRVLRESLGRLLLEEAGPLHPVGAPLEREHPVLDEGLEALERRGVEVDEVALRIALLGPVDLVRVGDPHPADRLGGYGGRHETFRFECQTDFFLDFFAGLTSFGSASILRSRAGGSPSAAFSMLPPSSRAIS